jgi:type III secretory pathway component EscV
MSNTDPNIVDRLARIETNLDNITETLKELVIEQNKAIRDLTARVNKLEEHKQQVNTIVALVKWLGASLTAAIVFFIAKQKG